MNNFQHIPQNQACDAGFRLDKDGEWRMPHKADSRWVFRQLPDGSYFLRIETNDQPRYRVDMIFYKTMTVVAARSVLAYKFSLIEK